jgi:hypothetical protein
MKKIILFSLTGLLLLSCKKNSSGHIATNTISATVDGSNYAFNQSVADLSALTSSFSLYEIVGYDSTINPVANCTVEFRSLDKFTNKTYGIVGDTTSGASFEFDQNGFKYKTASTNTATTAFTITITGINDSYIQGTFQGNIFNEGDTTMTKKVVTNGKFDIARF